MTNQKNEEYSNKVLILKILDEYTKTQKDNFLKKTYTFFGNDIIIFSIILGFVFSKMDIWTQTLCTSSFLIGLSIKCYIITFKLRYSSFDWDKLTENKDDLDKLIIELTNQKFKALELENPVKQDRIIKILNLSILYSFSTITIIVLDFILKFGLAFKIIIIILDFILIIWPIFYPLISKAVIKRDNKKIEKDKKNSKVIPKDH